MLGWYGLLGLLLVSRLQRFGPALLRLALVWLVVASLLQGVVYADPTIREQRSHLFVRHRRPGPGPAVAAGRVTRLVEEARRAGIAGERTRLAAEIHDTIAAGLSGILAQLEALDAEVPAVCPGPATGSAPASRSRARACRMRGTRSEHSARRVDGRRSARRRPIYGRPVGDRFDLTVEVRVVGTVRPVARDVGETVVRAVREALTNVAKHADAEHAYVTVSYFDDRVAVDIADDGHGRIDETANARGADGHGLAIMTERLWAVGGTVEIAAAPGRAPPSPWPRRTPPCRGRLMTTEAIHVLLVDDHPVVRDGLRGQLASQPDLVVIGEAPSAEEALAPLRRHVDR